MSFLFAEDEIEDNSRQILLDIYFDMCHEDSLKEKYKIKNGAISHVENITLTGNSTADILFLSFVRSINYSLRINTVNTINISSEKLNSLYRLRKFGDTQYIFKNESKVPANIILKTEYGNNSSHPIKGCKFIGCFYLISTIGCDLLNIVNLMTMLYVCTCVIISDKQSIINAPKMMEISKHDVEMSSC